MNNRIRFLLLPCALLSLFACSEAERQKPNADSSALPEAQRYGGTAVVARSADIPDLNPLTALDIQAIQIQQSVLFLPLIAYDEKLQVVPRLARAWEVSQDTTELTFHLRDDVFWHDGVKTTAHDLKFTYDRARDPKTGYPNAAYWTRYGDAEVVDSFTFRVKMNPHAEFLYPWSMLTPVPQHILQNVAPEQIRGNPFGSQTPVGNGPFRVELRQPRQSWTFVANNRFPKDLGGRPYLPSSQLHRGKQCGVMGVQANPILDTFGFLQEYGEQSRGLRQENKTFNFDRLANPHRIFLLSSICEGIPRNTEILAMNVHSTGRTRSEAFQGMQGNAQARCSAPVASRQ